LRRFPLAIFLLALLTLGGQQFGSPITTSIARAVEFEAVIWQFDEDYPGADNDDTKLPVQTVYIKTHDATDWMSRYDETGKAVTGPESIRRLTADYNAQGIDVVAWFVPKGGDVGRQVEMAIEVIDSGVKGLYADLEPFEGFCNMDCAYLAKYFWWEVHTQRPDANLGVIYDPRPWTFEQSATHLWLAVADAALPMCYWEDFVDQPPYNDPAGCVNQARSDLAYLAPGKSLEYIPMLQGNTTAQRFTAAAEAARDLGSYKVSVWRRGVVTPEVWAAARELNLPSPIQPAPDYAAFWVWSPCPWDGCLLQEEHSDGVYVIYGGAKFPIPSEEVMYALGWGITRWYIYDGQMATIPDVPADGTLLREMGSEGVYVILGGAKFPIPSLDVLNAMGYGGQRIWPVPPGGLNQIPNVPRDGTEVADRATGTTYQITGGAKFVLPDQATRDTLVNMRQLSAGPLVVPDGGVHQIPNVPREGTRIKELHTTTEYLVTMGSRFSLPDAGVTEEMVRAGHLQRPLAIVPDGGLAQVPGHIPDDRRVKEFGAAEEWQITGGLKFPIVDAGALHSLWVLGKVPGGEPTVLPPGALNGVPSGFQDGALLNQAGSEPIFVWRCGSPYQIVDTAQLERLKAAGLAREPVLVMGGPLVEPPPQERPLCGEGAGQVCPKVGWGVADPFAPAGCRPE
jgi:hypothetical protein